MQDVDFWLAVFGVAATVVGGVWSVFVYFDKRAARPAPSKPRPKARSVASKGSVSTAANLRVGGNLSVSQLPKGAVVVMLAGIALIAVAMLNIGDRISATRSVVTGGGISNSNISIGDE